eukprot:TRINITY_DN19795_c0_g1_i1.p1 TRINITY_DN19795_c0_g1~~TRINITY_DN19795_c0_g1_i1.p1  ORF type:complete len:174 (-),score=32.54 TRINITY_DN19795_c0_g1_i1:48-569(-)
MCIRDRYQRRVHGDEIQRFTGISPGINAHPLGIGAPYDPKQQYFIQFPGIIKPQPTINPPLAAFRNGPVKANTQSHKGTRLVPVQLPKPDITKKVILKPSNAKHRPSSPGVKGKGIETTYNIYLGSSKINSTTKQKYRVRSAQGEKKRIDREFGQEKKELPNQRDNLLLKLKD